MIQDYVGKRLYLRLHERVFHRQHLHWGTGVVEEVMTSSQPGGLCIVRVRFADGNLRAFINDLNHESCCYYFGVRRESDDVELEERMELVLAKQAARLSARARKRGTPEDES